MGTFKKSKFNFIRLAILSFSCCLAFPQEAKTQSTSNQSSVSNQAAPSASSVTTGGTNINYQTNNSYNNDINFGDGISCRTATLFLGGNAGKVDAYQVDPLQTLHNNNNNYQINAGIVIPIGSEVNGYCKNIASKISKDRTVASELSMLKACDDLLQKKIRVDPKQFPSLAPCENYRVMMNNIAKAEELPDQKKPPSQPIIKPVTDRAL